jgi:hypothetical protein
MYLITSIIKEPEGEKTYETNIIIDSKTMQEAKSKFKQWASMHNLICLHDNPGKLSQEEIELINENELNLIKL